jgi:hypothetical protein
LYVDKQFHIDATHASNHLLINGESQAPNAILRHGDKVQFGRVEALFRTDVKRPASTKVDQGDVGQNSQKRWLMAVAVVVLLVIGTVFWMF